jgi:hypothetical protein
MKKAGPEDPAVVRKQAAEAAKSGSPGLGWVSPRTRNSGIEVVVDATGATLGQQSGRALFGAHGVEQVAAIDAEIVEPMRLKLEQALERDALGALRAGFGEESCHETDEV